MKRLAATALLTILAMFVACRRSETPPAITQSEVDIASRPAEEWLREEPIRLLRDYVRIDTTLDHGEEAGARFLQHFFECEGIETELICPSSRRCNLFARLPGRRRDGALLLLNHIDVAPVTLDFWKTAPPFGGMLKRGYIYGRGTYDMKSIAIAQALAMADLKRKGIVPASDVLFLGEADEEIGQEWGSRWLLDHRPDLFRGVAAVLNEGGVTEVIIRQVRFFGLETLQAGYATAILESDSAEPLQALANRWRRLNSAAVEPHPQVVESFNLLANHLVSPLTDPLRHLDRVRKNPAELAILPDRYGAFLEARVFWSGTYAFPMETRAHARIAVVVSTPPAIPPERYFDPILADARKSGVAVVESFSAGSSPASPYPSPLTEMLRRVTEAHFPGVPFGPLPTAGSYTNSVRFRRAGFPTYGFSPIPMNIGDASERHGNSERVFLPDFLKGVEVYRDAVQEFALGTGVMRELSAAEQKN
jgi:acetylornithine deacetylase/succinyl-diaminopimelate desuccinylase-like protein